MAANLSLSCVDQSHRFDTRLRNTRLTFSASRQFEVRGQDHPVGLEQFRIERQSHPCILADVAGRPLPRDELSVEKPLCNIPSGPELLLSYRWLENGLRENLHIYAWAREWTSLSEVPVENSP